MNIISNPRMLLRALICAWLVGCGSSRQARRRGARWSMPSPARPGGAAARRANRGASSAQSAVTHRRRQQDRPCGRRHCGRVVYFDYDSYVLKDEFRPLIEG